MHMYMTYMRAVLDSGSLYFATDRSETLHCIMWHMNILYTHISWLFDMPVHKKCILSKHALHSVLLPWFTSYIFHDINLNCIRLHCIHSICAIHKYIQSIHNDINIRIALDEITLPCDVLHYITLHCTILHCAMLHYIALHYILYTHCICRLTIHTIHIYTHTTLDSFMPHYTRLHQITLHHATLHVYYIRYIRCIRYIDYSSYIRPIRYIPRITYITCMNTTWHMTYITYITYILYINDIRHLSTQHKMRKFSSVLDQPPKMSQLWDPSHWCQETWAARQGKVPMEHHGAERPISQAPHFHIFVFLRYGEDQLW